MGYNFINGTRSKLNIVVFLGALDVLDYFIERFVEYFTEKKINYYIADIREADTYQCSEFDEFTSKDNVCMLTFNNLGIDLQNGEGANFWKSHEIPVFNYIVDHPRHYGNTLLNPKCDIYAFVLDKNHVDFIKKYYKKVVGVYFSPNGGTETEVIKSYKDRKIDVLYMGNCQHKIEQYPPIKLFEDYGSSMYKETISYLIQNPMASTEEAIIRYLENYHFELSDEQIFEIIEATAVYIEHTVRRLFKLEGIKALDSAGINVDIYGDNWECDEPYSDNIRIHKRINIYECMKLIGDAKISLCYIPWYKKGCSEKNFDSMLNGALCVSDKSEYLDEHYKDGYNIIYFDLNNPGQMALDVKWLLEHPTEAEVISSRGYETAIKYDTWYNRAEYVLKIMNDVNDSR